MINLPPVQRSLYEAIARRPDPYEPFGVTDVSHWLQVSRPAAWEYVRALVRKNVLEMIPYGKRANRHVYRLQGLPMERLLAAADRAIEVCRRAGATEAADELLLVVSEMQVVSV